MKMRILACIAAFTCLSLGCNSTNSSLKTTDSGISAKEKNEPVTILIAAAASLKDCFENSIIPMFQESYPWVTVEGTYDSSGKLQTQIEEGMDASVFVSAGSKQMDALVSSGIIDKQTVVPLLENKLVLIAPADSPTNIDSFARINEADTIALGDPASVPAGQYAKEALENLGIWNRIQDKTSLGTNVTEVLNHVAEASADVGIVYATDAAQTPDKVKVLAFATDDIMPEKIIYPIGIVTDTPQQDAAVLFTNFLQSQSALQVFEDSGFTAAGQ